MFLGWGVSFWGFWFVGKWLLYGILAVFYCNFVRLWVCEKGRSFLVFFLFCLWAGKRMDFSGLFRLYFWSSKGLKTWSCSYWGRLFVDSGRWKGGIFLDILGYAGEGFWLFLWETHVMVFYGSLRISCYGILLYICGCIFNGYFRGSGRGLRWTLES